MGADQIAEMARHIAQIYEATSTTGETATPFCTFESTTPSGAEVWIQALPGNVNMAYPLTVDPVELLSQRGVRSPLDMYLVEWVAGEYATFGFSDITARDHASFVDQLFVKILGCDDGSYELQISFE